MIYDIFLPQHIFFVHTKQAQLHQIKGNTHHGYVPSISATKPYQIHNGSVDCNF